MSFSEGVSHGAVTDVGMRRNNNQDSHIVVLENEYEQWLQRGHVFVVADGMGAHAAGELASRIAVEKIPHLYHKHLELSPPEALVKSIEETNAEIHKRGKANLDFHGMGTTASVLAILPTGAVVVHVGDSRIYRVRKQVIEQLTFDHSVQWEFQAANLPSNLDLSRVAPKNVITRSMGPNASVEPDLEGPFPIELHDTFLLCSDGLSGLVRDEEIGALLSVLSPSEAVRALVDLANLRGGSDNITAIAVQITDTSLTTKVASREIPGLGNQVKNRPVHPALWIAFGVLALGSAVSAVFGSMLGAAILAAAAIILLLIALIGKYQKTPRQTHEGHIRKRSPYRTYSARPTAEIVQRLADTISEMRRASDEGEWNIDWTEMDHMGAEAEHSIEIGDFASALRKQALMISLVLKEIREGQRPSAGDSHIGY